MLSRASRIGPPATVGSSPVMAVSCSSTSHPSYPWPCRASKTSAIRASPLPSAVNRPSFVAPSSERRPARTSAASRAVDVLEMRVPHAVAVLARELHGIASRRSAGARCPGTTRPRPPRARAPPARRSRSACRRADAARRPSRTRPPRAPRSCSDARPGAPTRRRRAPAARSSRRPGRPRARASGRPTRSSGEPPGGSPRSPDRARARAARAERTRRPASDRGRSSIPASAAGSSGKKPGGPSSVPRRPSSAISREHGLGRGHHAPAGNLAGPPRDRRAGQPLGDRNRRHCAPVRALPASWFGSSPRGLRSL